MPINISTIYTKERLLSFTKYVSVSKKAFWFIMGFCTFLVVGCYAFLLLINEMSSTVSLCLLYMIVIDITTVFFHFVLPRFTIKKSKTLNTTINYIFDADSFQIQASNAYINEVSTVQYSMLSKVGKRDSDLYLFISRQQAYIVDLCELSCEQIFLLQSILETKVSPQKFKWTT